MWLNIARESNGGRTNNNNNNNTKMTPSLRTMIDPPGPPSRPGVLIFPPADTTTTSADCYKYAPSAPPLTTSVDATTTATATAHSLSAATTTGCLSCALGTSGGDAAVGQLPLTPPSKFKRFKSFFVSSKKDRRKKNDKEKRDKEEEAESRPQQNKRASSHPSSTDQNNAWMVSRTSDALLAVDVAWEEPSKSKPVLIGTGSRPGSPAGNRHHCSTPTRRSFCLTGHIPDLSGQRNVLPMWLEENSGVSRQSGEESGFNQVHTVNNDESSFDTRWDALRSSKSNSSFVSDHRPPGWEDISQKKSQRRIGERKRESFCPSFTIKDISDNKVTEVTKDTVPSIQIQGYRSPAQEPHEPCVDTSHQIHNHNLDMEEITDRVDNLFSDEFLYAPPASYNAETPSLNSPADGISQNSSLFITDRHLWDSSDSFICEDFSFCGGKPPKEMKTKNSETERAEPQEHLKESPIITQEEYFSPLDSQNISITQVQNSFVHPGSLHSLCFEATAATSGSPNHLSPYEEISRREFVDDSYISNCSQYDENLSIPVASVAENSLASNTEIFGDDPSPVDENIAFSLPVTVNEHRNQWYMKDDDIPSGISENNPIPVTEEATATLCVSDTGQRDHWITFDGESTEYVENYSDDTSDNISSISHSFFDNADPHKVNYQIDKACSSPPMLTKEHHGSTLNLVEPSVSVVSKNNRGRIVRSYSQRGHRASKRVINSVNRRISVPDYGKLREPVPPRYSRAALTMQTGRGLFEPEPSSEGVVDDAEYLPMTMNKKCVLDKGNTNISGDGNTRRKDSLAPKRPLRVGSLRVPRLPSVLVRRSVSFSGAKAQSGEVQFQRLSERRSSLRKAISGLGAFARSFRRKSDADQVEAPTTNPRKITESMETPIAVNIHRSESLGPSCSKQTPRAPRLPRRAISHKFVAPTEV